MARLVFDLDGTLVHSAPTMTTAANAMLAEIGRPPASESTVLGFVGHGMRKLVASLPFLKKKAVELLNGSTPEVGR